MKVLVFSRETDIDGMGGVILANLAFHYVTYELTLPEKLPKLLEDFYSDESIYKFDKIFITDLWLEEPMLTKVAKDPKLEGKIFVFDTHRTAIENNLDRYPFTTIRVNDEYGKCCGTSLFYDYLLENKYLKKSAKGIYKFVELTRKYDTWEWRTRYQDSEPEDLAVFYNSVGNEMYINIITNKLKQDDFHFALDENDNRVVEIRREENDYKIKAALETIREKQIFDYKAVILDADYEQRNIIADFLRSSGYDADFIMIVARNNNTVSFRVLNPDVNVRMIAEEYGGTGHDFAAKAKITPELEKIIKKD